MRLLPASLFLLLTSAAFALPAWQLKPAELQALARETPAALAAPLSTVVDKKFPAPSGDQHDYVSFARYFWPDPSKPDGLPYVSRDGQHNHAQVAQGDRNRLGDFCATVAKLAAAWHERRDEAAARRAGEWLRAWYLNPATRMNPNLNYAQIRLGRNNNAGSPYGVLDARDFALVIDALRLLDDSPALSDNEKAGIRTWFATYLDWLLTAPNALAERAGKNNHATWYLAHVIPIARFAGRDDVARELVTEAQRLIAAQIRPDGSQPEETRRVDGLGYSVFNLEAYTVIARHAAALGTDLWAYTAPNGASLRRALDFLRPYNAAPETWPLTQKAKLPAGFLDDLIREAGPAAPPTS